MRNELMLFVSLLLAFGGTLAWFALMGKAGLMGWTVLATIAANIEVLILVEAFGMEQTLGNMLFASSFLVTDILSELYGKREAQRAVNLGIAASLTFILISQSWLAYAPSAADWVFPSIQAVFSNTPRMLLAGLVVYAIVQRFDVWAYHKWWAWSTRRFGDARRMLWLRNNGSTLLSQLLNTVLFTLGAFWGTYDTPTMISVMGASYLIFIVTSLLDTPFVYLARYLYERRIARREAA